jgi:hypothetical protein
MCHVWLFSEYLQQGPKQKIFVAGIVTQIRPVWIGDVGNRPKNQNYSSIIATASLHEKRSNRLKITKKCSKVVFFVSGCL